MATYTPINRRIPSSQRTAHIASVIPTDELDFRKILGRPARGMKVIAASATDVVEYRLVSYTERRVRSDATPFLNSVYEHSGVNSKDWTVNEIATYTDAFTNTGAEFTLVDDLSIEGFIVDALTGPANVEIVVW